MSLFPYYLSGQATLMEIKCPNLLVWVFELIYILQIDVKLVGVQGSEAVLCSRNVKIVPDTTLAEASKSAPYDVVVLPGGANGAKNLAAVSFLD